MDLREHKNVAWVDGLNVHEGHVCVVFIDDGGLGIPSDDATKNAVQFAAWHADIMGETLMRILASPAFLSAIAWARARA
jgi:hypothetical protein